MAPAANRQTTSSARQAWYRLPATTGAPRTASDEALEALARSTREAGGSATRHHGSTGGSTTLSVPDLVRPEHPQTHSPDTRRDDWLETALPDLATRCVGLDTEGLQAVIGGALRESADALRTASHARIRELEQTVTRLERALDASRGDLRASPERLQGDFVEARRGARTLKSTQPLVAESRAVQQALVQIEQVAPTTATVLLLGETGAGKEVFAEAIHELSPRRQKKMVRVNCAAIPSALIESELFGRERGAYTGALSRQIGRFELAEGSTIFLDEIGELPLEVQVKLLRVLQTRVVERLGSVTTIPVDVRIIAATNRDLDQAVADKTFREDLYYRLNVFPIRVPPLRERVEDIPALVWTFIEEAASACGKRIESLSKASLHALQTYSWPGNVRELRNVTERAVITATGPQLVIDLPRPSSFTRRRSLRLSDVEADHIRAVLESSAWRVRGRGGAAELLGMKPTTLESRMAKLGIVRPDDGPRGGRRPVAG
jgi:transcriptional regulator with GAF, ATPase, and Fis domain